MKKYRLQILILSLILIAAAFTTGTLVKSSFHQYENNPEEETEPALSAQPIPKITAAPETNGDPMKLLADEYPYSIAEDRKTFDPEHIDITVGDHLYMTQINDWFINFADYADKTVAIEGYYLNFQNGYQFIGRNGPTCPYCTGGYVDFEIQTDYDTSKFKSGETWISIKGILRQGKSKFSNGKEKVFYYIETITLEEMPTRGVDPITD